jgi:hydroxymethylpyrimidine/phosphomethylpyrimidine kinase
MPQRIPHVLSIAGSDSGGGAGIQADLKTIAAFGCYGMTAITSVTSQNSLGVHWVEGLSTQSVDTQIHAVVADFGVQSVKVGMLGSQDMVQCVARAIEKYTLHNVVIDPVLVATSGATLGDKGTANAIAKNLFPLATLITPNLYEASIFLGREVKTLQHMKEAATDLLKMGPVAVLLKGGHLEQSDELTDILAFEENGQVILKEYQHQKIRTKNSHGTGCTLSAAIACGLGSGLLLTDAILVGIDYVQQALLHGSQLKIAQGAGPLWHAYEQYPQVDEK